MDNPDIQAFRERMQRIVDDDSTHARELTRNAEEHARKTQENIERIVASTQRMVDRIRDRAARQEADKKTPIREISVEPEEPEEEDEDGFSPPGPHPRS